MNQADETPTRPIAPLGWLISIRYLRYTAAGLVAYLSHPLFLLFVPHNPYVLLFLGRPVLVD